MTLNAVNALLGDADVVLAAGTMFKQEDTAGWRLTPGEKRIHIDIDPQELGRSYPADVGMEADAKAALQDILAELPDRPPADSSWMERARTAEQEFLDTWRKKGPVEMRAVEILRASTPPDALFYFDRCNLGYWAWIDFLVAGPRTFHFPMGYGGIGPALPQAIGGKIACPDKPVVSVIGDGGFQFTGMELAVAVQEKSPITVIVCNNQRYGAIAADMQTNFGHADLGCDIGGPDLQKFAAAYGMPEVRVDDLDHFGAALKKGIESNTLNLIELTVELMNPPWS